MRVAQVSGHFPPNFVSGGTLVPQRLARAAAAAGEESYVFAGYLGEDRTPLETWEETDPEGVEVTWVATTPWTGWSDRRNFDNPEAAEIFREWLARVQPDVVHFHSIQTLGAGLIPVAAEVARVVVTMHDFWWTCARQFLVDRDMVPCSLVAQCGVCECEAGAAARAERAAFLGSQLAHADLVLAPSGIARDVFVANGVDPERIRVDENGLPAEQLAGLGGERPERTGDVRFLFAGTGQPMKGADVLADALRSLGEIPGAQLDLVGPTDEQLAGMPRWVSSRERYLPEDLGDVLSGYDVLILPSVMRESHSILTREALAAGLAVLCTDTLGPEEAVGHEYNGLIVPAADAVSLADAIARLAADPEFTRSLMGKGSVSPVRHLADQVEGDLALYRELAAPSSGQPSQAEVLRDAQRALLTDVLFVTGIQGAPLRYRVHLATEALGEVGIGSRVLHYRSPELPGAALAASAVVFYRVPATVQVLEVIDQIKAHRPFVPILFDIDDLIFDPTLRGTVAGLEDMPPEEEELWWRGVARYRTTLEACDGYIGSTTLLTERATELTGLPSYRFANGVGELLAKRSDQESRRPRNPGPVRIGYFSGTTMHDADWAHIEKAVTEVMDSRPEVELLLGGHLKSSPALERFGERVQKVPFVPWFDLPAVLRDTDICLAPLTDGNQFNEAKSAIKWLEAALVGTPTLASPTEPFREAIDDGVNGFLPATHAEWVQALTTLIDSPSERARMGAAARRTALLRWSPAIQGRVYANILVDASLHLKLHGRRAGSPWEPVMDDEPFSPALSHVEEYALAGMEQSRPPRFRVLRRVGEILRTEGVGGVTRRVKGRLATRRALARRS